MQPDLGSNNASLNLQLMGAPWITPVPYSLPGPKFSQSKALVTAKCGPRHLRGTVDILVKDVCSAGEPSKALSCQRAPPRRAPALELPMARSHCGAAERNAPVRSLPADTLSKTPLTLECYSRCPSVQWDDNWPLDPNLPRIYNLTDRNQPNGAGFPAGKVCMATHGCNLRPSRLAVMQRRQP